MCLTVFLSLCCFEFSVDVDAFVSGLSQIFFFYSVKFFLWMLQTSIFQARSSSF